MGKLHPHIVDIGMVWGSSATIDWEGTEERERERERGREPPSNAINWWHTPAESPDLNPIENFCHELKEYIRREVKPKMKQDLIDGIQTFWSTVDVESAESISNTCVKSSQKL